MVLAVKTVNLRIGYLDEEEEKIQWAVRGVDLEIQEGESFALLVRAVLAKQHLQMQ